MKDNRTCGTCGRIRPRDLGRNYCPFTAGPAYLNKPADRCICYIPEGSKEAQACKESEPEEFAEEEESREDMEESDVC